MDAVNPEPSHLRRRGLSQTTADVRPSGPAERPARPVVTYGVMGICAVVYLMQWLIPTLIDAGDFSGVSGYLEPWRFLTSAFLHSPDSVSHLLFNMMALYTMGQFLEPFLGRARFVALYLLSALGGSVGCVLLLPALVVTDQAARAAWYQPMVGASGAVFGLFTAAFLVLRRTGAPAAGMLVLLAINAALPFFIPNIAWQAHVGGAVTGLIVGAAMLATSSQARRRWTWPVLLVLLLVLVGAAWAVYAANARPLQFEASLIRVTSA